MSSLESKLGWVWLASLCSAVRDLKGSLMLQVTFVPPHLELPGAGLNAATSSSASVLGTKEKSRFL